MFEKGVFTCTRVEPRGRDIPPGDVGRVGTTVYQLIYQSACRPDTTTYHLRDIARESSQRNRERDITGVMLVQGTTVLQVLEGPEDAVIALYERIRCDTRHVGCTVLFERHCDVRAFSNWRMGVCEVEDEDSSLVRLAVASLKARQKRRESLRRSA